MAGILKRFTESKHPAENCLQHQILIRVKHGSNGQDNKVNGKRKISNTTDKLGDMETVRVILIIDICIQENSWLTLDEQQVMFKVEIYGK